MRGNMEDNKSEDIRSALAGAIWELAEDEAEANKGYECFLAKWKHKLTLKQIKIIEEHIADEYNHILALQEMTQDISRIKPSKV